MLTAIFIIAVLTASRTHAASTVTATCEVGPKVAISIAGATNGYTVYIMGTSCATATISTNPQTYNVDGTVIGCPIQFSTPFSLVIQQYSGFVSSLDEVFTVTCSPGLKVQVTALSTTLGAVTSSVSATFSTTVSLAVLGAGNAVLTSAAVGDSVKLKVSIPASDNVAIGFSITSVKFTVSGTVVEVIKNGCPFNNAPIPKPINEDIGGDGAVEVLFNMFLPVSANSRPAPGSSQSVAIEVSVSLCSGSCSAVTCPGRRKRRAADETTPTEVLTLTRPLVILPPGMSVVSQNETVNYNGRTDAREVTTISTALIATVVALGLVLALCIVVLVFMFCRLRRHMDAHDSKQSAFENKAYN